MRKYMPTLFEIGMCNMKYVLQLTSNLTAIRGRVVGGWVLRKFRRSIKKAHLRTAFMLNWFFEILLLI